MCVQKKSKTGNRERDCNEMGHTEQQAKENIRDLLLRR